MGLIRAHGIAAVALFSITLCSAAAAAAADSVTYQYYPNGRLHTVTYGNGTVITYVYDTAGNRQTVSTSCATGGC